ncbi:hypothetical protein ES703_123489 [subsurface metagenome]
MVEGLFGVGLLVIAFGVFNIVHNAIGTLPFDFPYFEDTTSIIAIVLALVVFGVIFRTATKK